MTRLTIYFTGRVQGVGFRYTTARIASRYAVSGYVKNLPDRRVLLVTEGTADEVKRFVDDVAHEMNGYIRDQTSDESPATGEFGTPGLNALTIRR